MMPAGYSGTALVKKLGIKPGMRVRIINPPDDYDRMLGTLPADLRIARATRGTFGFIQIFVDRAAELERKIDHLKQTLERDGMLWICWPKASSGVATDLSENVVRRIGLSAGLVDIKVCAVDETWSGLKFVYRLKDR